MFLLADDGVVRNTISSKGTPFFNLFLVAALPRYVFARFWHAVEFSFEFCPSVLGQAVGNFKQLGQDIA